MFLYFLPELPTGVVKPDQMVAAGLGHALTEGHPTSRQVSSGPGGAAGVLAVPGPPAGIPETPCEYRAGAQTWRKGPGGKYWVGLWNDRRPGPADLARPRQIAGEQVRLRDGNDWTVPIARSVVRGTTLPKEIVLGEDNESWESRDLPEFLSLCADAEQIFTMFHGGEPDGEGHVIVQIPYKEGMRVSVEALAVNYRVGVTEVAMLRLFGDEEMERVLRALCDLDAYTQMLADRKKKEQASVSSPTAAG